MCLVWGLDHNFFLISCKVYSHFLISFTGLEPADDQILQPTLAEVGL